MKKFLILFIVVFFSFLSLADGFLYPTTEILPSSSFSFAFGNTGIRTAMGINGNFEFGYAFSPQDIGTYMRYSPLPNAMIGISYLPFSLCLFGTCENASLLNAYGVYTLPLGDFDVNLGLKMISVGFKSAGMSAFCVLKKKFDDTTSFLFEGGVNNVSNRTVFSAAFDLSKRFWFVTLMGGCVWPKIEKVSDITSPCWCFQVKTTFAWGK